MHGNTIFNLLFSFASGKQESKNTFQCRTLLKVEKGVVLVHKCGKGTVDELVENFDDTMVLFGYLRTFVGY